MRCVGFEPYINEDSKILILGSFPSVKSREVNFYYGNPRNRFWTVMGKVFGEEVPSEIEGKKEFLKRRGIALWDMVTECDIDGSMDANIKNAKIADLPSIMPKNGMKIFANGKTAYKFLIDNFPQYSDAVLLPSTSPANPRFSFDIWENAIKNLL